MHSTGGPGLVIFTVIFITVFLLTAATASTTTTTVKPTPGSSCVGRCNQTEVVVGAECQCHHACQNQNNSSGGHCCPDYVKLCHTVTDAELAKLSEELLTLEKVNNVAPLVAKNLQGKTKNGSLADVATLPLLAVQPAAWERPTIALLSKLYDNYYPEVNRAEEISDEELGEEAAFLDAIFGTPLMKRLQTYLAFKGFPTGRDHFHEIWFGLYSRSGVVLGSSGFEHVFLGEIENNRTVGGFHTWSYFANEEAKQRVNYRGWMNVIDFGTKGSIVEQNFEWLGAHKPISSMFIGTSPEFDLSLYTLCWYARPDKLCPVSLNGKKVMINTQVMKSPAAAGGRKFVFTTYADLSAPVPKGAASLPTSFGESSLVLALIGILVHCSR